MTEQIFSIGLDVNPKIEKGDSVIVSFTLTNLSEDDQHVLTWHTPLEGLISSQCFEVIFEGKPIAYDGVLVMRVAEPGPDSYLLIAAKGKISVQVDLTEVYALKGSGKYTITTTSVISRLGAPADELIAEPVSVSFELTGTPPAKRTLGEIARSSSTMQAKAGAAASALAPTIIGGTCVQRMFLCQAWKNAYSAVNRVVSILSNPTQTNCDFVFAITFNVPATSDNKTNALGYYLQIKSSFETDDFTLHINPTQERGPYVYAYSFYGYNQILFNPLFFTACDPIYGESRTAQDNCQPYVIIHEMSHAICYLSDAVQNPPFESAYSMGYFAARVALPVITGVVLMRPADARLRTFTDGALYIFNPSAIQYQGLVNVDFYLSYNNIEQPGPTTKIGDCVIPLNVQSFTPTFFMLRNPNTNTNLLPNIVRLWSPGLVAPGKYYTYSQIRNDGELIGAGTYTISSFSFTG